MQSSFFEGAFNSAFREGKEQEITLDSCTIATFDMIVKCLFTGVADLGNWNVGYKISLALEFIIFADYVDLARPAKLMLSEMKAVLLSSRTQLDTSHIRTAIEYLPAGHAVRTLFADASVKYYARSLQPRSSRKVFKYQAEMNELEGYASDLVKSYTKAIRKSRAGELDIQIRDPFTQDYFDPSDGRFADALRARR